MPVADPERRRVLFPCGGTISADTQPLWRVTLTPPSWQTWERGALRRRGQALRASATRRWGLIGASCERV